MYLRTYARNGITPFQLQHFFDGITQHRKQVSLSSRCSEIDVKFPQERDSLSLCGRRPL